MNQSANPFHRDEPEGVDERGRLHGASAVRRLLNSIPTGPDWNYGQPVNFWMAADAAVEEADTETKDAALRHLLSLHMHDLTQTQPQVAVRNIHIGDVIEMSGVARKVTDVRRAAPGQAGGFTAVPERGTGKPQNYNYSSDVHVPLRHRVSRDQAAALFARIVDATEGISNIQPEHRRPQQRGYRDGLLDAYLALTGADSDEVHEAIEAALQVRHEERIAAEQ